MRSVICAAVAALTLTASHGVFAAPVTFFGEDLNPGATVGPNAAAAQINFLNGLSGGVGTENFESFSNGNTPPLSLVFPGSTGSITANLTGTGGVQIRSTPVAGRFATSGTDYLQVSSNSNFTISFSSAVSAFGFLGTDIGDFVNGNLTVTLTDTNNVSTVLAVPHNTSSAANAAVLFWGFIDTSNSYTSLTFTNPGGGDVFGFDDMTIGDAQQVTLTVTEPGTVALFGLSFLALGLRRRRG